jgi:UDP-glucose 4-epimerase
MPKVLVTGVTGFLGSHIADKLLQEGIAVVGLKRTSSNLWRCIDFAERIEWVDIESDGSHIATLNAIKFDKIIHCAWMGVESSDRDNWDEQISNVHYLMELLQTAKGLNVDKIIVLGSQAEYGIINGVVTEEHEANALTAYGGVKLASLEILKSFCNSNNICWIWLRIFSVFGEKENSNWLIPSLIKSMSTRDEMDFSPGEQKYAYLYINDFAVIMTRLTKYQVQSGIYNVSSNTLISIKSLIETIRDKVRPDFQLNFGALEYRENQSMLMGGDISKLFSQIGELEFTDFNVALQKTVDYYINN